MWLAAGCCYSEVGKEERNLLSKVLTAEDTTKVKSSLWFSKRDVEEENSTLRKSSPPLDRAGIHLWELQGWSGGWVLPACVSGRGSPWRGAWAEKAKGSLLFVVLFCLQSVEAEECFVFSVQTLGLLLLCCSVIRGVIYPALHEIGLITKLQFPPLILKNLLLKMHFALNTEDLTIRC